MFLLLNAKTEYKAYQRVINEDNKRLGLKRKCITKKGNSYFYYYHLERRSEEETEFLRLRKKMGLFKGNVIFKDRFYGKEKPPEFIEDIIGPMLDEAGVWRGTHLLVPEDVFLHMIIEHPSFMDCEKVDLLDVFDSYAEKTKMMEEI